MPRYEYQCSECGVRFERAQHYDDAPVRVCPECGNEVHRLIGPVGVVFKGSGFYSTDHKKGKSSSKN
jgi:putative FmdB family regulatory protein